LIPFVMLMQERIAQPEHRYPLFPTSFRQTLTLNWSDILVITVTP
jgi:hypothetical protein